MSARYSGALTEGKKRVYSILTLFDNNSYFVDMDNAVDRFHDHLCIVWPACSLKVYTTLSIPVIYPRRQHTMARSRKFWVCIGILYSFSVPIDYYYNLSFVLC